MSHKIKKTEFAGSGAVVQALGMLVGIGGFFLGPELGVVGLLVGIALLVTGSNLSKVLLCPKCRNRVSQESAICPCCKEELEPPRSW